MDQRKARNIRSDQSDVPRSGSSTSFPNDCLQFRALGMHIKKGFLAVSNPLRLARKGSPRTRVI